MLQIDNGWRLDVERGPDWVFVRLHPPDEGAPPYHTFCDEIWSLLAQCFTYRVVLELDHIQELPQALLTQLVALASRIHAQGGMLRLCGLPAASEAAIRACGIGDSLPHYPSREEAVMGHRPMQPR